MADLLFRKQKYEAAIDLYHKALQKAPGRARLCPARGFSTPLSLIGCDSPSRPLPSFLPREAEAPSSLIVPAESGSQIASQDMLALGVQPVPGGRKDSAGHSPGVSTLQSLWLKRLLGGVRPCRTQMEPLHSSMLRTVLKVISSRHRARPQLLSPASQQLLTPVLLPARHLSFLHIQDKQGSLWLWRGPTTVLSSCPDPVPLPWAAACLWNMGQPCCEPLQAPPCQPSPP